MCSADVIMLVYDAMESEAKGQANLKLLADDEFDEVGGSDDEEEMMEGGGGCASGGG